MLNKRLIRHVHFFAVIAEQYLPAVVAAVLLIWVEKPRLSREVLNVKMWG